MILLVVTACYAFRSTPPESAAELEQHRTRYARRGLILTYDTRRGTGRLTTLPKPQPIAPSARQYPIPDTAHTQPLLFTGYHPHNDTPTLWLTLVLDEQPPSQRVSVILETETIDLGTGSLDRNVMAGYWSGQKAESALVVEMPTDDYTRVCASETVAVQIGAARYDLPDTILAALRPLADAISAL